MTGVRPGSSASSSPTAGAGSAVGPAAPPWRSASAPAPTFTMTESFLATSKTEFNYRQVWPTKKAARVAVGTWIENRYNRFDDNPRSVRSPRVLRTAILPTDEIRSKGRITQSIKRGQANCLSPRLQQDGVTDAQYHGQRDQIARDRPSLSLLRTRRCRRYCGGYRAIRLRCGLSPTWL